MSDYRERSRQTERRRSSGGGSSSSDRGTSGRGGDAPRRRSGTPQDGTGGQRTGRRRKKLTWQQKVRRFFRRLYRKIRRLVRRILRLPREILLLAAGLIVVVIVILIVVNVSGLMRRGSTSSADTDTDADADTTQETGTEDSTQETETPEDDTGGTETDSSDGETTDTAGLLKGMDNYTIITEETEIAALGLSEIVPSGCDASSVLTGTSGTVFGTDNLFDDDLTTSWQEGEDDEGIGVTLTLVFPDETEVRGIAFWIGNETTQEKYESNNRPSAITISVSSDGQSYSRSFTLNDLMGEQLLLFAEAVPADSMVIRIDSVYEGTVYNDTVISEIKFVN